MEGKTFQLLGPAGELKKRRKGESDPFGGLFPFPQPWFPLLAGQV